MMSTQDSIIFVSSATCPGAVAHNRQSQEQVARMSATTCGYRCTDPGIAPLTRRRLPATADAFICPLVPVVRGKALKLALHRIDLGEIGRDEVIAAALAGRYLKATVRVSRGGTGAAEMDDCGEILRLLRVWRRIARASEN